MRSRHRKHWGPFDQTVLLNVTGINLNSALPCDPQVAITESRLGNSDFFFAFIGFQASHEKQRDIKNYPQSSQIQEQSIGVSLLTLGPLPLLVLVPGFE